MKKLLLTLMLLGAACLTYAQGNRWELGIAGGPNESSVHLSSGRLVIVSTTPNDYGPTYNYFFGLTGQYNVSRVFSIKGEVDFARKGFVQSLTFVTNPQIPTFVTVTDPTNLDYLEIPILAKAAFGKKTKFFINAGPYFGYLLSAVGTYSYSDSVGNIHKASSNIMDEYKKPDLGLSTGLGIDVPVNGKLTADVEARFDFGLYNISDTGFYINKNQSADLIIGLRYNLF